MPTKRRLNAAEAPSKVWFSPDEAVARILMEQRRQKVPQGAYINSAIEAFAHPPMALRLSDSPEQYGLRLKEWLEKSRNRLEFMGISHNRLIDSCADTLEQQVRKGVHIDVTFINPAIISNKSHHLYGAISSSSGGDEYADRIFHQAERAMEFFMKLRKFAMSKGVLVNIRTCEDLPPFGIYVMDRGFSESQIRVNIYTSVTVNRQNHYMEIRSKSMRFDDAYPVFLNYYDHFLARSDRVSE